MNIIETSQETLGIILLLFLLHGKYCCFGKSITDLTTLMVTKNLCVYNSQLVLAFCF